MIFADSHAHLSLVAEELGREKLAAILDSYFKADTEADLEGRPGPIVLYPGVDRGDLPARISSSSMEAEAFLLFLALPRGPGLRPRISPLPRPA